MTTPENDGDRDELDAARSELEAAQRRLAELEAARLEREEAELSEAELAARRAEVERATTSVFRTALRSMLVLVGVVTVVGSLVGLLVSGTPGLWGALLGAAVTVFFSGTTVVSMLKTTRSGPQTTALVVLGGWVLKMFVLLGVLAVLREAHFYDRYVFAVVLLVGTIGSAALDYRAVSRGRVPYVAPGSGG